MKIEFLKSYKSFTTEFEVELPEFTVLTGLNGSGKTHFLLSLNTKNAKIVWDNRIQLQNIHYVNNQTLSPNNSDEIIEESLSGKINEAWKIYNLNFISAFDVNSTLDKYALSHNKPLWRFLNSFKKIAETSGKDISKLSLDDFYDYDVLIEKYEQNEIFVQNFSSLFKRYANQHYYNVINHYRNEELGEKEISYFSSEEFVAINGEPPWDLVQKIIDEANLDYKVNNPSKLRPDQPYKFQLINKLNGASIDFDDLSSGEKAIMSLSLALYNSDYNILFPEIILMDEPDASLHPSMTKQFLDVIQNIFVKEKGIFVVMTTHSPSTVALAPEESIFVVKKTGNRIEKTSKDKALKILTVGVPSFSVNYENRRQVFVESKNDVYFYEKLYKKLSYRLESEISLSFIDSGDSQNDKNGNKKSNCNQVKKITELLRENGNRFIFGVIDWDKENKSTEWVKVLGENNRYSIENFIFEPIFIAALLLQNKLIERSELALKENETYTDFRYFETERLQFISDIIISKIEPKISSVSDEKQVVRFVNDKEIFVPKWYLQCRGHDLEDHLKDTFPRLKRFNQENALKNEVLDKIIDDIPDFISVDILNLFKEIQNQ